MSDEMIAQSNKCQDSYLPWACLSVCDRVIWTGNYPPHLPKPLRTGHPTAPGGEGDAWPSLLRAGGLHNLSPVCLTRYLTGSYTSF